MQTRLRLFLDWGITFGEAYQTPDRGRRKVYYADRKELEAAILEKYPLPRMEAAPQPVPQAEALSKDKGRHPFRKAERDTPPMRP